MFRTQRTLIAGALILQGCTILPFHHISSTIPSRSCPPDRSFFDYERLPRERVAMDSTSEQTTTHKRWRISFPSLIPHREKSLRLSANYWQNKVAGRKGVILIVPIIDGPTYPSDHLTIVLTSWHPWNEKFHVITLGWNKRVSNFSQHKGDNHPKTLQGELFLRDTIRGIMLDVRRLLDWLETRGEMDATKIGIAGGSKGAILASLAMGIDARIRSGFFMGGGGDLPEILTHSRAWSAKIAQQTIVPQRGDSSEIHKERLRLVLHPVDPLTWAGCIDPRNVLIIDAHEKTKNPYIPTRSAESLWIAMGRPRRIIIETGHRTSFLAMTILGLHSADFALLKHFSTSLEKKNK